MSLTTNSIAVNFADTARTIVAPAAARMDQEGIMDQSYIQKIAATGYLGANIKNQYGGLEYSSSILVDMFEEFGRVCSSTRSLFTVQGMVAAVIEKWGTTVQHQWLYKLASGECIGAFCLTEPGAGSDMNAISMKAESVTGGYLLTGVKKWITFGQIADLYVMIAKLDNKPTAFLVPSQTLNLQVKAITGILGYRASMLAQIHAHNCFVPEENMLGGIGNAFNYVCATALDYGRFTVACGCIGMAQACLEECCAYARKRIVGGNALSANPMIKSILANMVVKTQAIRMFCREAAVLRDSGDSCSIIETCKAKYYAAENTCQIASDAVQLLGGIGCSDEMIAERFLRDSHINRIIEGSKQIQEILIANQALMTKGKPAPCR